MSGTCITSNIHLSFVISGNSEMLAHHDRCNWEMEGCWEDRVWSKSGMGRIEGSTGNEENAVGGDCKRRNIAEARVEKSQVRLQLFIDVLYTSRFGKNKETIVQCSLQSTGKIKTIGQMLYQNRKIWKRRKQVEEDYV